MREARVDFQRTVLEELDRQKSSILVRNHLIVVVGTSMLFKSSGLPAVGDGEGERFGTSSPAIQGETVYSTTTSRRMVSHA